MALTCQSETALPDALLVEDRQVLRTALGSPSVASLVLAVASCAIADQKSDVQAWLATEWKRAGNMPPSDTVMIRWRMADVELPAAVELDELRRIVGSNPNAPQRLALRLYESTLAGDPPTSDWVMWADGQLIRLNCTSVSPSYIAGEYSDLAVNGRESWAMSRTGLDIGDTSDPDPGFDRRRWSEIMKAELALLLTSGLSHAVTLGVQIPTVAVEGDTWTAEAGSASGWRVQASGTWNGQIGRGTISEVKITGVSGEPRGGIAYRSRQTTYVEVLGAEVPSRLDKIEIRDEKPYRTYWFQSAEKIDRRRVEELVRTPEHGRSDAVRGEVLPNTTLDLRSKVRLQTIADAEGVVRTPIPRSRQRDEFRWLRTAGWVCCGCILAALVLIRVRRSVA